MPTVGAREEARSLPISFCPWESSEIHFPSLDLSHVICISSISIFCCYCFVIYFPTPMLSPLADISVRLMLTQSSLYSFCTLSINSLQKIKFIALTLMLYVAYHASWILSLFLCFLWSSTQDTVSQ